VQLRDTLRNAIAELEAAHGVPARLHAEVLLMHVLHCDRAYLFAHPEREIAADEQLQFARLMARRAAGEPLQYLTGHQEFWGQDFLVTSDVLIPRPETEHLIEAVLELVRACHPGRENSGEGKAGSARLKIVDVGTGSGAIAITLARELPMAEVYAVDVSPEALAVARANAERLGALVHFLQSDLLGSFARGVSPACNAEVTGERKIGSRGCDASFDFVVSNPPYVGLNDAVQEEVRRHEPLLALFAGGDGLDVIRRLIPQAREALRPSGWLVMEIGHGQEADVHALLTDWAQVQSRHDLAGIARVILARKPTSVR
jgi:release factor glutamine methyltransferase